MAYTKTTWVNDQQPDIDADNLNKMEQGIYDAQFPDGGTEGQLLARTANGRGWVDPPNSAVWGLIQGTLSDQTDLAYALANTGKVDSVNGIQPDVYKNVQVDVEITKDGWDALPSTKYTDDINYYIKDGTNIPQASVISASGVTYSNTSSGLDATTVQGAIDENASEIADVKSGLMSLLYPTTLLNSSSNMDNIDCGTYYQSGGSMPSNAPSGANNAYIVVLKGRNVDRFQIWIARNTANIQIRMTSDWNESTGTGTNWTAWTAL